MISDAVDPDISCLDAARQFHRREIVVGPDRRGESMLSICDLNSLVEIIVGIKLMIGPNTSSCAIRMVEVTLPNTVGSTK